MSKPASSESETTPPGRAARTGRARVRARRSLSPIWFVPIVAALITVYIAWQRIEQQGPLIEIDFETAEGLVPGRTPIKFKDVDVGVVETVTLGGELADIRVRARMQQTIAPWLTDNASFWIVRPRVGVGGVSGLSTLLSGTYVEMDTSPGGEARSSFTGLEEPPLIRSTVPGQRYILTADALGSVTRGAPIFYRGVEVGQVMGYELDQDGDRVITHIFVRAPHDTLVTGDSKFWDAGGVRVSAGSSGFNLAIPPLQALLVGGIEFDRFTDGGSATAAPGGHAFNLYASRGAISEEVGGPTEDYVAYFDGSVRGLQPGAPVEFRGIRVGTVTSVQLDLDAEDGSVTLPVGLRIEPGRIRISDATDDPQEPYEVLARLVARGLRAQLSTASILTGDLYVALDFHTDLPKAELVRTDGVPEIPTVPSQLDQLTASVTQTFERVARLPLEQMVGDARAALQAVQAVAGGPETTQSIAALEGSLVRLESLMGALQRDVPPAVASLRDVAQSATATMRQVGSTASSLDQLFGSNSQLRYDLVQALRQLASAARSIRDFADYLDRHPDALIRGRQGGR